MRNAAALSSVAVGLLAVAALPATVVYADRSGRLELIWAGVAVPAALLLGLLARLLARRGRRRSELTLLHRSGARAARVGALLGTFALLIGGAGVTALVVYALLTYRGGT